MKEFLKNNVIILQKKIYVVIIKVRDLIAL